MVDSWCQVLSPHLARRQLLSRLTKILQFATTNIDRLDRSDKVWREDLDPYVSVADKAIIETALLVLVASRISNPSEEIRALLRELVLKLSSLIRTERNRTLLMRYPHTVVAFGMGHAILASLRNQDEEFDYLVRQALASGHIEAIERLPYRSMDVRWVRGLIDPDDQPEFDDLLPHSILTSRAHPIQMSAPDTYALTHALMYVTDFGMRPIPAALDVERAAALVDSALAYHLLSENLDLLGELLISAAILGASWSPYAHFAWHLLTLVWDHLGFLPSPTFEASTFAQLSSDQAPSYSFRHLYHTMYVGGMLCGILLGGAQGRRNTQSWHPQPWDRQELIHHCEQTISLANHFCHRNVASSWEASEPAEKLLDSVSGGRPQDRPQDDRGTGLPRTVSQSDLDVINSRACEYLGDSHRSTCLVRAICTPPLRIEDCALVLTDALLSNAAQDYDLRLLAETLSFVADINIPLSITFREATAFVLRQQTPKGAIGAHFVVPANQHSPAAIKVTASLAECLVCITKRLKTRD